MVKIIIERPLFEEIEKKFKRDADKVFNLIYSLKDNPRKGKILACVGTMLIKELKHKGFRFYFIVDGFKLKVLSEEELVDLLMRFVRMSDKKHQAQTIEEIREVLLKIRPGGFV
ncbi:hypothetical protein KY362_04775 [Candidatus Woesearchaeota archaeon]|nr:hypothetical protein [Candidatus Woesearchaeota archaeon]